MLRALLLSLSLLALCLTISLPARADSPAVLAVSADEAILTDQWLLRMTEARTRREQSSRWAVPLMLAGAGVLGAGFAVFPDVPNTSRLLFGASALLPVALIVPAVMSAPPTKARWLAVGGFAFAAAFSAAGLVAAADQSGCSGWCGNEKSMGWLAASFLPTTGLLQLAFIDRGPSLKELEAYAQLPAASRAVVGRKLLARIDRAERKAMALSVGMNVLASLILGAGAATVRDQGERNILLGFGGATLSLTGITALIPLLRPSRLEQLTYGRPPATREMVVW